MTNYDKIILPSSDSFTFFDIITGFPEAKDSSLTQNLPHPLMAK